HEGAAAAGFSGQRVLRRVCAQGPRLRPRAGARRRGRRRGGGSDARPPRRGDPPRQRAEILAGAARGRGGRGLMDPLTPVSCTRRLKALGRRSAKWWGCSITYWRETAIFFDTI